MKIIGDTHTHTIACKHAYSTLLENVAAAKTAGLHFLALTDHGPAMEGSTHIWYFMNLPKFVPPLLDGLVILRGCEANIMPGGVLDIDNHTLAALDWVIASMHRNLAPSGLSKKEYTDLWLKVLENPYIDCVGHLGHPAFDCDHEAVVMAAARLGKAVEINSSSPTSRPGCEENCRDIIRLCKKHGVKLVLSSDAHFATGIGQVDWSMAEVTAAGFPEQDILNLDYNRMAGWLKNKKGLVLPE